VYWSIKTNTDKGKEKRMTVKEASIELGTAIIDLVQAFALNQVKKQRMNDTDHEIRRLIHRRAPGEFQIRSASRKCRIVTLF
jgi:hypothetical protein